MKTAGCVINGSVTLLFGIQQKSNKTIWEENSVKNRIEMPIFHTAICAGASQIAPDGRHELDIRVATPSLRSGMEE